MGVILNIIFLFGEITSSLCLDIATYTRKVCGVTKYFQSNDPRRDRFVYTSPKKYTPGDVVFAEFSKCMRYFTVHKSH